MKINYPKVLSEDETINLALAGRNISRFGDGEIRLVLGGTSASQKADDNLARELRKILSVPGPCLPCIPNLFSKTPKHKNWVKYATGKFTDLYKLKEYGSSFVTRPDSAPWIDRPDYWEKIRLFWKDRDVTLVAGSQRSLTRERMPEAKSVRVVEGRYRDSYSVINELVETIGKPSHLVILCLGAAGTCLAARLANQGVWAVDLGHVGLMLKYAGTNRWAKAS